LLEGVLDVLVALGSNTEVASGIEHTIVEGEITRGDLLNTLFLLNLPVTLLQLDSTSEKVSFSDLARPEGFYELLEFTLSTDVGETEVSSRDHVVLICNLFS
jgi:hypothetical protein